MVKCAVDGCTNYQGKRQTTKAIKFFCFPKDPDLCRQWIAACGEGAQFNFKIARICSEHFTEQDWKLEHLLLNVSDDKKRLKTGTVPTQNLPLKVESQVERLRKQKELVQQAIQSYDETQVKDISSNFFQTEVGPPLTAESGRQQIEAKILLENDSPSELQKLRLENKKLRLEATKLLLRVRKSESVVSKMERIFTKGQIKRLKNPTKNCNWDYEDVAHSISLYTASPLMYQMLWKKKYPLPSPSTLRKWAATLKLRPGIIGSTLKALTESKYNENGRLCILSFFEIRLRPAQLCEEPGDTGLRPYKYAQVFMVRGLVSEWKHIIYYNFDCMMPELIMKEIIRELKEINFTIVAAVSGVGPRKLALWRGLKIHEEQPWFEVFDGEKIFFFANVPHLIKRLRNHFLESGFMLNDTLINVDPLSEMLAVEPSELWVSHDLNQTHISPKRVGRHNLQVALQLFSQSVAEAIRKCVSMGKMYSQNAIECSDFIQVVDEWFGVFNSKYMSEEGGQGPMAYGLALDEQNAIIASMNDIMTNLRLRDGDGDVQPFQKGILLNNCSLPRFYEYLKHKHNVAYVITNNLNPDDMEHPFGIRRSYGGIANQPSPLEFKYRLRAGILMNLYADKKS